MYLLDSNAVIGMLRGHPILTKRLTDKSPQDFALPSIVAHELYFGAFRGQQVEDNLRRVDAIPFRTLEFDREDARCAGQIRAELASLGVTIGPFDVLIAGQALARSMVLITHNTREFSRVPTLLLEDWELP